GEVATTTPPAVEPTDEPAANGEATVAAVPPAPETTPAPGAEATTAEQQASLDAMVESRGAQTAAVSDKLKELEGRMLPEFTKPLEEQPIAEMIREYEAIQRQPLPAVDRQIVRMRLAALHKNQGIADTLKTIRETRQSLTPVEE